MAPEIAGTLFCWRLTGRGRTEYSTLLQINSPSHLKLFRDRLKSDPDAAKSEAAVFSWLRAERLNPTIAESVNSGGVDYRCAPESRAPFLVEVTHLDSEAITRRSGLPDEIDDAVNTFSQITPKLWAKAKGKAAQLADHDDARVLIITLLDEGSPHK